MCLSAQCQHRATALFGTTTTGVTGLQGLRHGLIAEQTIVKRQLLALENWPARLDENAALDLVRHAVGAARMVDPFGVVALFQRINHPPIVQVKVKRVIGVGRVMRVTAQGLGHGDDLPHILDDCFARCDVARGEHAFTVHSRRVHPNGSIEGESHECKYW